MLLSTEPVSFFCLSFFFVSLPFVTLFLVSLSFVSLSFVSLSFVTHFTAIGERDLLAGAATYSLVALAATR